MYKHDLNIWSGKRPIADVIWTFLSEKKFQYSSKFIEKKNDYWRSFIREFPHVYDGNLLFLDEFSIEEKKLILITRSMRFSTLVYLNYKRIRLSESLGSIGFQIFIRDPNEEKFLLGKRAQFSDYKPGYYTIPGGMFEVDDCEDTVEKAILREVEEELSLCLDSSTIYLTNILRELNDLGVVLLLECTLDDKISSNILEEEKLPANEEWEEKYVYWYPYTSVSELDHSCLMEGLLYEWISQSNSDRLS
jgi:ADP-ribose pyrophosphatase YjhB (NUDIX family)